jgi:drug/metabolite transporter (DMT)-like permease
VILFWSGNATVIKVGVRSVNPPALIAARFLIAGLVVLGLQGLVRRRLPPRPPLGIVGAGAMLGIFCNQLAFNYGVKLATAVDASIIMGLVPVFGALLVMAGRRARLPLPELAAVVLGFSGLVAVAFEGNRPGGGTLFGDLVCIGAPLSWSIYIVVFSHYARRYDAFAMSTWAQLVGGLFVAPLGIADVVANGADWVTGALPLAYTALAASAFGYTAYFWALPRLGVTATAMYTYFQPLVGALMGAFFLGEHFGAGQAVGAVAIVGAAYLGSWRRSAVVEPAPARPPVAT